MRKGRLSHSCHALNKHPKEREHYAGLTLQDFWKYHPSEKLGYLYASGKPLQIFFSLISNLQTLQDLIITAITHYRILLRLLCQREKCTTSRDLWMSLGNKMAAETRSTWTVFSWMWSGSQFYYLSSVVCYILTDISLTADILTTYLSLWVWIGLGRLRLDLYTHINR